MKIQMQAGTRKQNLFLFLVQGTFWAAYCCYYGFLVMYLTENGYTEFECGLATTLMCCVSMALQPVIGFITDTVLPGKWVYILSMALAIPLAFLLPVTVGIVPLAICSILALSAFDNTMSAVLDSWTVKLRERTEGINFNITRSGGSLFYALTALIFGNVISVLGYQTIFVFHGFFAACSIIVALMIQEAPVEGKRHKEEKGPGFFTAMGILMKIQPYLLFVLCCLSYQFSIKAVSTFLPVVIRGAGGGSGAVGAALFLSALGEVPSLFLVGRVLGRVHIDHIFTGVLLVMAVRIAAVAFLTGSLPLLLATSALQGFAHGFYIALFVSYINRATPFALSGTAITLGSALTAGVGSIIGNFFGGLFIEWMGIGQYLIICGGLLGATAVLFAVVSRRMRRKAV